VQRAAVRSDPHYAGGDYADYSSSGNAGPLHGMAIARMFGTICYRSREEFDLRFSHRPKHAGVQAHQTHPASASLTPVPALLPPLFDVESYLRHAASTFTGRYDANCYLTLSQCMDLMDMGQPEQVSAAATGTAAKHAADEVLPSQSLEQACSVIPHNAQFLLLPVASDALIPAGELERLGSVLGAHGRRVHCERVHSLLGHDAFLKDMHTFAPRMRAFLERSETDGGDGVENVRRYVSSLHDI